MSDSKLLAKREEGSDFASSSIGKHGGGIMLYGHDMGPRVEAFIGRDEYEFFYSVEAEHIRALAAALSREKQIAAAPSGSSEQHIESLVQAELLQLRGRELDFVFHTLIRKYKGNIGAPGDFSKFCEKHSVPVEFSSYP